MVITLIWVEPLLDTNKPNSKKTGIDRKGFRFQSAVKCIAQGTHEPYVSTQSQNSSCNKRKRVIRATQLL